MDDKQKLDDENLVNAEIKEYLNSEKFEMSFKAKEYYKNRNDIIYKQRYIIINGEKVVAENVENNIIAHPIFRDLVDQKINYLLGNDWNVENEQLAEFFNDDFRVVVEKSTADAVMCGIGWFFPVHDGTFLYVDALGVIPIWKDISHTKLDKLIRMYNKTEYIDNTKKEIKYAELWSLDGVKTFRNDGTHYKFHSSQSHLVDEAKEEGDPEKYKNWTEIPFIYIKYNQDELSLLSLVKPLIDKMDKTASDTQDLLSDLSNKTTVVTGATGTDIEEFANNKKLYRLAFLPEGANYTEVGTEPDITSAKTWIEHLRNQIYIAGRGYDPLQAIGANASGEARRNLYTSLDLDANQLEAGIIEGLRRCIKFLNMSPTAKSDLIPEDTKIKFNRNIMVNQSEQIQNAKEAQAIEGISKETIVGMTGLVDNVQEEIKKAEAEKEAEMQKQADIFEAQDNKPFEEK